MIALTRFVVTNRRFVEIDDDECGCLRIDRLERVQVNRLLESLAPWCDCQAWTCMSIQPSGLIEVVRRNGLPHTTAQVVASIRRGTAVALPVGRDRDCGAVGHARGKMGIRVGLFGIRQQEGCPASIVRLRRGEHRLVDLGTTQMT